MVYLLTKSVRDDRKLQVCLHVRRFLVFFLHFYIIKSQVCSNFNDSCCTFLLVGSWWIVYLFG